MWQNTLVKAGIVLVLIIVGYFAINYFVDIYNDKRIAESNKKVEELNKKIEDLNLKNAELDNNYKSLLESYTAKNELLSQVKTSLQSTKTSLKGIDEKLKAVKKSDIVESNISDKDLCDKIVRQLTDLKYKVPNNYCERFIK